MSTSVKGNGITCTATFVDSTGAPVSPDPDTVVTWTVYSASRGVRETTEQTLAEETSTGTFELEYVPEQVEEMYVEARGIVGGVPQTIRLPHTVTWT